jgi:hypothetical protein
MCEYNVCTKKAYPTTMTRSRIFDLHFNPSKLPCLLIYERPWMSKHSTVIMYILPQNHVPRLSKFINTDSRFSSN